MHTSPHIVLVHGLGRSRYDMFLLAPRLREVFPKSTIHTFEYHSRRLTIAQATEQLARFVETSARGEPVSFVGHSLGGIIARSLDASGFRSAPLERLVTLGSPHNGAVIAKLLSRYSLPRAIFGPVLSELGELLPQQPQQLAIGCIIGATGTRYGWLPLLGGDNDGLVLVREARLGQCVADVRVPTFHGYMPFSGRVARLAARFLSTGAFD